MRTTWIPEELATRARGAAHIAQDKLEIPANTKAGISPRGRAAAKAAGSIKEPPPLAALKRYGQKATQEVHRQRFLRSLVLVSVVLLVLTLKNALAEGLQAQSLTPLAEEELLSPVGYVQNTAGLQEGDEEPQPHVTYVQWGSGGRRTVRCESQNERYAYCPTYTTGRVRLQQQLSNTPCQQYATWGTDGDGSGIWVRNGCRAIFVVSGGDRGTGGSGRTLTCKSEEFRYNRCPIYQGRGRVRLSRQLSDASCVRGSSWGVDRDGIWVNHGCAAEFTIR